MADDRDTKADRLYKAILEILEQTFPNIPFVFSLTQPAFAPETAQDEADEIWELCCKLDAPPLTSPERPLEIKFGIYANPLIETSIEDAAHDHAQRLIHELYSEMRGRLFDGR